MGDGFQIESERLQLLDAVGLDARHIFEHEQALGRVLLIYQRNMYGRGFGEVFMEPLAVLRLYAEIDLSPYVTGELAYHANRFVKPDLGEPVSEHLREVKQNFDVGFDRLFDVGPSDLYYHLVAAEQDGLVDLRYRGRSDRLRRYL